VCYFRRKFRSKKNFGKRMDEWGRQTIWVLCNWNAK